MDESAVEKIRDNPFYVLGLRPSATRAEVEREGQKLLGMLELKLSSAAKYPTPVGPGERTADKVRRAMAELRDPERRLEHELWARLEPAAPSATSEPAEAAPPRKKADAPWAGAMTALGWRAAR
jgi:curved DNA-binding protein CbpA